MPGAGLVTESGAGPANLLGTGPVIESKAEPVTKSGPESVTKPEPGLASTKKSSIPIVLCHNHYCQYMQIA